MIGFVRRDSYYQERARELRRNMTDAEKHLWYSLRAHRMDGHKFRRQHALGQYIVDFVCLRSRLIIEVDGGGHGEEAREALDAQRTAYLEKLGFRVMRFWNTDVLTDLDTVTLTIYEALNGDSRPSPQPSPLRGEGESKPACPIAR
jgi:very-short-patch-repair endonuclease